MNCLEKEYWPIGPSITIVFVAILTLFSASLGHKKGGQKDIDHRKKQK